jgi:DNA-binding MarR family transcriptional regulator
MKITKFLDLNPSYVIVEVGLSIEAKINLYLKDFELGFMAALVLLSIFFEDEKISNPGTIQKTFKRSKGNISHILSHLEAKKYISRKVPIEDKRKCYVLLTEKGIKVCCKLVSFFDKMQNNFEQQFSESKLKNIIQDIEKINLAH